MHSDADSIISDSEPEYAVERARQPSQARGAERSTRRRTSDERPGLSTGEGDGRAQVLVLSSASEDEGAGDGAAHVTSAYFAPAASKRRRIPSPRNGGEWAFAGLAGLEYSRSAGAGAHAKAPRSGSTSHEQRAVPASGSRPGPSRSSSASTSSSLGATVGPSAARASAPSFVSARDLLRTSTSSQLSETYDELLPPSRIGSKAAPSAHAPVQPAAAPKPRQKRRSASISSASSLEIVEPSPRKPTHAAAQPAAARTRTKPEEEDASAASSSGSLPAPSSWKERFEYGAPRAASATAEGASQAPTSTARKKPWEEIEADPAKGKGKGKGKGRKAAAVKPRTKAKKEVKTETIEVDELDSDADDVVVASSSKATKTPRPASTSSRKTSLAFLPTPIDLPADDRIRLLTSCALCSAAFAPTKALSARQNHLRSCAAKLDFTAATLSSLVDAQLLALASAADAARRTKDDARTLFDIAIGRGQGASAKSDVHVVGVEEFTGGDPGEWYRATKAVQDEMDLARKKDEKPKDGKLLRAAKEIRRERAEAAARGEDDGWTVSKEEDEDVEAELALPPATGRLRPETSTARNAVAQRAGALLGAVRASSVDVDGDDVLLSDGEDGAAPFAFESTPPRPTQVFEPSSFAARYAVDEADSSIEVLVQPAIGSFISSSGAAERRSRVPFRQLSQQDPCGDSKSDEGPHHHHHYHYHRKAADAHDSLWRAAAGRDNASVRKVVAGWDDDEDGGGFVLHGGAEAESSEEEPLATVVKRTSTPRRKRRSASPASSPRAKRVAPPPSSSDDSLPAPPVARRRAAKPPASAPAPVSAPAAPDYSALSLAALQREVAKYGFRPSKERAVLERQLCDVWRALHPDVAASAGDAVPATPKKTRGRKKKAAAPAAEEESEEEDNGGETAGEKIRRLIIADEKLYLRILRYEPVHFDEFVALAAKGGVKIAKPLLVRCLDEQSITFYTQDPTGGTRRRYR
ncbi:hypothetical protein JCM10450v2_006165 [Rhodotorula kratochvilovae]